MSRGWRAIAVAVFLMLMGSAGAATCTISAVNLVFGSYNPFRGGHTDTTGNIAVTCTGVSGELVAYSIALNPGASGSFLTRRMRYGAAHTLQYNIYVAATRSVIWGDGNGGSLPVTDTFALSGAQVTRNYPVYGRAFAGQNVPVGPYTDSIVATLNF